MFQTNEAAWDRILRLIVAVVMVYWGLAGRITPLWQLSMLIFSLYPLITGVLGWDPVYVLIGFRGTRDPADR